MSESLLHRLAWIIVALCVAPIVASALAAFTGDLDTWRNVLSSVLPRYTATTLILVVVVGLATAVIGSITAWLVKFSEAINSTPLRCRSSSLCIRSKTCLSVCIVVRIERRGKGTILTFNPPLNSRYNYQSPFPTKDEGVKLF